jgi:hypothetical protein
MSMVVKRGPSHSKTIRAAALPEKCPSYPAAPVTTHIDFSPNETQATNFLGAIGLETGITETEARYRISFDRSRQKRGPPDQTFSLFRS